MEPQREKLDLTQFIDKYHNIISAIGIFVALTIFTGTVEIKILGKILSFVFLILTILLWFELLDKFPRNGTPHLILFENLLTYGVYGILVYSFVSYSDVWKVILFFPIAFLLNFVFTKLVRRYEVFNRTFHVQDNEKKWLRYLLYIISSILIIMISIYLSYLASPIFDFISKYPGK